MTVGGIVGVVGASGGVGVATVGQLRAWGVGPLRLGVRDRNRLPRLAEVTSDAADVVEVNAQERASLAAFCRGCAIVVNCTGPSFPVAGPRGGRRVCRGCRRTRPHLGR